MSGHAKPQTLEQKIEQGIARRQFTFSPVDSDECRLSCNWCQESLLIDYFAVGYHEMSRRITAFASVHGKCQPTWRTKPKDMMLTPKEKIS